MNKTFAPVPVHATRPGRSLAAFGLALLSLAPAVAMQPLGAPALMPVQQTAPASDRLIIKLREPVASSATSAATSAAAPTMSDPALRASVSVAANRAGLHITPLRAMSGVGTHVLRLDRRLDAQSLQRLAEEIRASDSAIEYVEPDWILTPQWQPNDPLLIGQWHYASLPSGINLRPAWDLGTGKGVVVGVLDSGVVAHADLRANLLAGYDFVSSAVTANDGDGRDPDAGDPGSWTAAGQCGADSKASESRWHGTHVAGTIAASANNGKGVAGVAPGARILPLRVTGRCGGYTSDIIDALIWATGGSVAGVPANPNPAQVLNISLGGKGTCGLTLQNAINTARGKGAVVVVSAGNFSMDVSAFALASCKGVISVAATGAFGTRASYSNFGASITLAAPGGDGDFGVLSTLNTGMTTPLADSYGTRQGTSMAAPHVAGVVALMRGRNPALTPGQIETLLKSGAATHRFPFGCSQCGIGIIDARRAIEAAGAAVASIADVESNDTLAKAQPMAALPAQVNGTIGSAVDLDHYRVVLPAGKTLTATLTPNDASDYDVLAYDSLGKLLVQGGQGVGQPDRVQLANRSANPVTLTLRIARYTGLTGPAGTYSLVVSHD